MWFTFPHFPHFQWPQCCRDGKSPNRAQGAARCASAVYACVTTAVTTADDPMAFRRTRRTAGPDLSRTTVARAIAIAEQLRYECSVLLDLYVSRGIFVKFSVFTQLVD